MTFPGSYFIIMWIKCEIKEWSVHVMNMTPIKKIIIGLVVVCIAITLITANNLHRTQAT